MDGGDRLERSSFDGGEKPSDGSASFLPTSPLFPNKVAVSEPDYNVLMSYQVLFIHFPFLSAKFNKPSGETTPGR